MSVKGGSLVVVGTGIQCPGQLTIEAKSYIAGADKVFYLVTEPVARSYIERLNKATEDLYQLYSLGKRRIDTYDKMVDKILSEVRKGRRVCAAFYGHPGVFVHPSHTAIRIAREEGYPAVMLPATSAEDCLFADLGVDPAVGCHSYEATSFLVGNVKVDPLAILILWQIGAIGVLTFRPTHRNLPTRLQVLSQYLQNYYSPEHRAIIYEATAYPICKPRIEAIMLKDLKTAKVTGISTLCMLPTQARPVDKEMAKLLGIRIKH